MSELFNIASEILDRMETNIKNDTYYESGLIMYEHCLGLLLYYRGWTEFEKIQKLNERRYNLGILRDKIELEMKHG